VAALAGEGRIRLDDPVERYLGGIQLKSEDPKARLTVRHLLTHTAGLVDSREPLGMHYGTVPAQPPMLLFSSVLFPHSLPGSEVRYSTVAYGALGLLLTSLSGQTIPEHFQEKLLGPLRMRSTAFAAGGPMQERLAMGYNSGAAGEPVAAQMYYHSPDSPLLAADGLVGTARDLAEWLLLHLNCGRMDKVISARALQEMHEIQFPLLRGRKYYPQSLFDSEEAGWGLGWIVWPCDGGRCIGHTGQARGYTAIVAGDLARKNGVAILTNADSAVPNLVSLARQLLRRARADTDGR
jgi:D-alanyl-D-alanine carboxypeptidase